MRDAFLCFAFLMLLWIVFVIGYVVGSARTEREWWEAEERRDAERDKLARMRAGR